MKSERAPLVSVIVPTCGRPSLVLRAVKSALIQTLADIEVVVVIDGPDHDTAAALATITDSRVSMVGLSMSVGGSEARNIGIRRSRGEFIALLDDDDEWLPSKLSRQLDVARKSKKLFPVVTCRLIARRPIGDEVWPSRSMGSGESMSEYLFCRSASIRQGEGFIQSSTLFVPRALMMQIPFRTGLPRHQDWDWLIQASNHPRVEFTWVWEPLVIYHIDGYRKSVSGGRSLEPSVDWVDQNSLVTPKARAYFYATQVAVRCRNSAAFWLVVRNTIRYPRAFSIAMGLALVPRGLVYRMRPMKVLTHA